MVIDARHVNSGIQTDCVERRFVFAKSLVAIVSRGRDKLTSIFELSSRERTERGGETVTQETLNSTFGEAAKTTTTETWHPECLIACVKRFINYSSIKARILYDIINPRR